MHSETIIKRLQEGPAVLFVGQNYLAKELGHDLILEKIRQKYIKDEFYDLTDYKALPASGLDNHRPGIFQWLQALSKTISTPCWLEEVAKFPWSAIYTSSYDTILERAFSNETRTIQPILNQTYLVNDPRNKKHLHITYLLGSISAPEIADRVPLKPLEFNKRKSIMNAFLQKLQNIVTPRGILVIDGYTINDQLSTDEFYGYLDQFGHHQVLICSAEDELLKNEGIADLINREKVVASSESFATLLSGWESEGKITYESQDGEEYFGKWLTLPSERVKIPEELISKVSRSSYIIDDSTFYSEGEKSEEEKYKYFRKFLSNTSVLPDWKAYPEGFAFKRDYYNILKASVVNAYNSKEYLEAPIFLLGQTSSGKTTSLGLLAYELREEYKIPVLFIPKRYQRGDDMNIDSFCRWVEGNKAKFTVIIWDGMLDVEPYYKLLRFLNQRGRRVILVCSSYNTDSDKSRFNNFVEAPIELTEYEKSRFVGYLRSVNDILANIVESTETPNLLALLYRYLPANLNSISSGVHDEYKFFVNLLSNQTVTAEKKRGDLYHLMYEAGLIANDANDKEYLDKRIFMSSEKISVADFLIFSIMVPGQFGLNVPFEIILDVLGFDAFASNIFTAMKNIDMIRWFDDDLGNIDLGPRTTLEAEILARYAGGKKSEAGYMMSLLERIKTAQGDEFGAPDRQIEFAVNLLREIGPSANNGYSGSFYEITEILRSLRENLQAYHPRLVLKESSMLRKIVQKRTDLDEVLETNLELLTRAEEMVRKALDDLGQGSERMIASYLRVELATICGYLAQQFINQKEKALEYYWQVRSLNNYSFTTNPGNYLALDIAAWTTERLLEAKVFNTEEQIEATTDLLSLFEMVEAEGVSDEHLQDFQNRKLNFYEVVGLTILAEDVFQQMRSRGFTTGIYLRARKKLGLDTGPNTPSDRLIIKNKEAYNYLIKYFNEIKSDGRSLFLLLKTWWTSKTGTVFFSKERQAVDFDRDDWDFCLHITSLLLACEDKFHSATVYYLKALAQFHLDLVRPAMDTFEELQQESYQFSYGRRRIAKYYVYSTVAGGIREFSGDVMENVSRAKHDKRGEIYVPLLDIAIPFSLLDFKQTSYQKGDRIPSFGIAFNFLGPIAVPIKG